MSIKLTYKNNIILCLSSILTLEKKNAILVSRNLTLGVVDMILIRELRKKAGMTQEQLSEKLGINRTTVTMWELGKSVPRPDKLAKLAKILQCSIDDLFAA